MPLLRWFALAAVATAIFVPAPPGAVAAAPVVRVEQVGFDGLFKVGKWTPLTLSVETSASISAAAAVEAIDPDGNRALQPGEWQTLQGSGHSRLTVHFQSGRLDSTPRVFLLVEQRGGTRQRPLRVAPQDRVLVRAVLKQSVFLVATLGRPAGLEPEAASQPSTSGELRTGGADSANESGSFVGGGIAVAAFDDPLRLPADALGYDGLDTLVIAGNYDLPQAQSRSVRDWVRLGGHLVVAVGQDVDEYLDSSLGGWVSGGPTPAVSLLDREPIRLRELSALESYSDQRTPLEIHRGTGVAAAPIGSTSGQVLVRAAGARPVAVRVAYGFGRITFLGIDLNRPPLAGWPALPGVVRKLTGMPARDTAATTDGGRLSHTGITELASQIHRSQQQHSEVERSNLWTVMGLVAAYLVIVGPLDYLVVHRLLRRPHLTWLTFPLLVLAAAAAAGWTAAASNGGKLLVKQLDLVDIEAGTDTLRARSWMTLYSPRTARYRVECVPAGVFAGRDDVRDPQQESALPPRLCWSGVPENVFGGLYRSGGMQMAAPSYRFEPRSRAVENLPAPVWSTRSLIGRWHATEVGSPLVESRLTISRGGQLAGGFTHRLNSPITDWMIAWGTRVYLPRDDGTFAEIPPDRAWPPGGLWSGVRQRDLSGLLTGAAATFVGKTKVGGDEYRIALASYDPFADGGADAAFDILRMLTFHGSAGGTAYSGLDNNSLRSDDLSDLLAFDRALLLGRIEPPAAEWRLKGPKISPAEPERVTVIRLVLPVVGEEETR
ncbi:MAG: DUF4350 domain-containing protein [Planctomycetes bacterium]|nr:DUF4350 domain-containing protein [Planctomycetota bacterium]